MKKLYTLIIAIIFFCSIELVKSQNYSTELTVQLSVIVQNNPTQITLNWINDGTANGGQAYLIYRRISGAGSPWGSSIAGLSASASHYVDNNVIVGNNYEYFIRKSMGGSYGYINSSIELPVIDNRGKLILVVENTFVGNNDFDNAITQTIEDIEADGWIVKRIDVNRNDAVTSVKQLIVNTYNLDVNNTKALYLLGHVPVPYSGITGPDYHAIHLDGWPADVYYADMDGVWTDNSVNYAGATRTQNHNVPA
jgi:hypothetical protein